MRKPTPGTGLAVAALLALAALGPAAARAELAVLADNPRWLTTDGRTALVLTGAHTWSIFQDQVDQSEFDAGAYLDSLAADGHNFTRGWYWEDGFYAPLPYELNQGLYRLSPPYNLDYMRRLRSRLRGAHKRGLYASVMLFQGWSMDDQGGLRRPDPWPENPYNRDNHNERVTKQQAALHIGVAQQQQFDYVSFVAGRLCSEPNVIWEIVNEAHPDSLGNAVASNWQGNILAHLEGVCEGRLTWVSCPSSGEVTDAGLEDLNDRMRGMGADLFSPCDAGGRYSTNPPVADGRAVVVADSDHLPPSLIDAEWAWKAFLRGQHPIFMDLTQDLSWWRGGRWDPEEERWTEVRAALGAIQELVALVNRTRASGPPTGLAAMVPQRGPGGEPNRRTRPASSPWSLYSSDRPCRRKSEDAQCRKARANGEEFLAWAAEGESLRFCRLEQGEDYRFRWKRTTDRGFVAPSEIAAADPTGCLEITNPASGTAVVHLERHLDPS